MKRLGVHFFSCALCCLAFGYLLWPAAAQDKQASVTESSGAEATDESTPVLPKYVPKAAPTFDSAGRPRSPQPVVPIDPPNAPAPIGGDLWVAQGPGPMTDGGVENAAPKNQVVGAVQAIAAHPTNRDIIYIGGVNGGLWKTANFRNLNPNWTPLIDQFTSLSIGCLQFDPTDAANNTLVAGIGVQSSFFIGGMRTGLLRTIDGGTTWAEFNGGGFLVDKNMIGVAPRAATTVVAVNTSTTPADLNTVGIFKSINSGATFFQVSGAGGTGLPQGACTDLAGDLSNNARLYTSVVGLGANGGIYRSNDTGATWAQVNTGIAAFDVANAGNVKLAVTNAGGNNVVYAIFVVNGQASGIYRSANQGGNWTRIGLPGTATSYAQKNVTGATNATPIVITCNAHGLSTGNTVTIAAVAGNTNANNTWVIAVINVNSFSLNGSTGNAAYGGGGTVDRVDGLHTGAQGNIHLSIAADPTDSNLVYVGGDAQPLPSTIGATEFTGRLFRGDASAALANRWMHLTHSNAVGVPGSGTANCSAPHADSRRMVFDADNAIVEGDDGGVFLRTNPKDNTGRWFSGVGDSQLTEAHNIAYDAISDIIIGGTQDNGIAEQIASGSTTWHALPSGDGGDVAVDNLSVAPNQSIRYGSSQNLSGFTRRTYNKNNIYVPLRVANATNANPIRITTTANHGLVTGDLVAISGVQGNTNANVFWRITRINNTDFDLRDPLPAGFPFFGQGTRAGNAAPVANTGQIDVFPGMTVVGGAALPPISPYRSTNTAQFVTPIAINAVDGTRIVFGGSDTVYESNNGGSYLTPLLSNAAANVPVNDGSGHRALAYGGKAGGANKPEVLYVGSAATVFVRPDTGGALVQNAYPGAAADIVRGIALNPDDWTEVYVVNATAQVFRAVNSGNAVGDWTNITSNLSAVGSLHCVEYIKNVGVVVGADLGVFICTNPAAATPQWNEQGTNLPNAPVWNLQYNVARDMLVASTMGRGVWRIYRSAANQNCCLPNGMCANTPPQNCAAQGGFAGGIGSACAAAAANQRCCMPDGTCIDADPSCCAARGGTAGGVGTACAAAQQCRLPGGGCVDTDPACCAAVGGTAAGAGTACGDAQACCLPNNTCANLTPSACAERCGSAGGVGTMCAGANQRCCFPQDGSCFDIDPACCTLFGGIAGGGGTACAAAGATRRCCLPGGFCVDTDAACCAAAGGATGPAGSACANTQRCCLPNGSCILTDPICCANSGGVAGGAGTICAAPRRCCLPNGTCLDTSVACCTNIGGTAGPVGSSCAASERCCLPNGTCVDTDPACCANVGGTSGGAGTTCVAPQRCCMPDGTCVSRDPGCCTAVGGTPGGTGTSCAAPQRCCLPNGTCVNTDPVCCVQAGGIANGVACVMVRCCLPDGSCINTDATCCGPAGGVTGPAGSACATPQRCCLPDGSCVNRDPACCAAAGGVAGGAGTACAAVQRCCLSNGTCVNRDPACCALSGGIAGGAGTACVAAQRCCLTDGSCVNRDPACCAAIGGTAGGVGTACAAPQRCCFPNNACTNTDPVCCAAAGGTPGGAGTVCATTTYNGGGTPIAIPDNNVSGVTLTLSIPDSYIISDLNFSFLFGSPIHTWYDDINMRLTHVDTGTTVLMMNGTGNDNSDLCGPYALDDSAAITFDQAAANETTGTACIPSGSYRPDSTLSAFNGQNINGTWQLLVWDDAPADTGTLQAWSLSVTNAAGSSCQQACACRGDINVDGALNGKDIRAFLDCLFTGSTPGGNCVCADMDHSGGTGVSDVSGFVSSMLTKGCGP